MDDTTLMVESRYLKASDESEAHPYFFFIQKPNVILSLNVLY